MKEFRQLEEEATEQRFKSNQGKKKGGDKEMTRDSSEPRLKKNKSLTLPVLTPDSCQF